MTEDDEYMTPEEMAEVFEQSLDWYKALSEFGREHRALQWQDARNVLERERKARLRPVWADETARKYV